jgi:hypothetical protein
MKKAERMKTAAAANDRKVKVPSPLLNKAPFALKANSGVEYISTPS